MELALFFMTILEGKFDSESDYEHMYINICVTRLFHFTNPVSIQQQ